MASDTAQIVIAQAETGHEAPAEGELHATTETTGQANLEHAETGMPQLDFGIFPNLIFWLVVALLALYFVLSRVAIRGSAPCSPSATTRSPTTSRWRRC